MGWFAVIAAAVGGVAFWRRKTLKDDAAKAKEAGMDAVAKAKEGGMDAVSKVKARAGSSSDEGSDADAAEAADDAVAAVEDAADTAEDAAADDEGTESA